MSDVPVELRMVWDAMPEAHCKGLCQDYCGPILASPLEVAILAARGITLPSAAEVVAMAKHDRAESCPALSDDGRCTVYDVRPSVCRMFGTVELPSLIACPHGCGPTEGRLTAEQAQAMMRVSIEVGIRVPYPGRRRQ